MKRTLFLALLLIASIVSAQEQLPPGHVHAYAGAGLVMSLPDGRIAVAIGSGETVERIFILQTEQLGAPIYVALRSAAVDFWHDSLTVVAPTERVAFVLSLHRPTPRPALDRNARPEAPATEANIPDGYAVARYYGFGLADYSGFDGSLGLNETELSAYLDATQIDEKFTPYDQKPPGGGGGGGGTNCAASCSYSCLHGVAQASCTPSPPWCALCNCRLDGSPIAYCYQS